MICLTILRMQRNRFKFIESFHFNSNLYLVSFMLHMNELENHSFLLFTFILIQNWLNSKCFYAEN